MSCPFVESLPCFVTMTTFVPDVIDDNVSFFLSTIVLLSNGLVWTPVCELPILLEGNIWDTTYGNVTGFFHLYFTTRCKQVIERSFAHVF